MRTFVANKEEHRVLHVHLQQEGTLFISTTIEIRGNHLKGAVPVRIIHVARFVPDEKYWEHDEKHPDEEPYPVSYHKDFDSTNEREYHVNSHYKYI